jgi:homoserine O-acetyltransferase
MVLETLGVQQVAMVVGGSMGGCQALEWAYFGACYVRSVVAIACSARQSAWAIAWNETQRSAICADSQYHDGHYSTHHPPKHGLGVARTVAMLTYRAHPSYSRRFGRRRQLHPSCVGQPNLHTEENPLDATPNRNRNQQGDCAGSFSDTKFAAESYLAYQKSKFTNRFDANCYVAITHKMDSHDLARGRTTLADEDGIFDALRMIQQPVLVVGIDSDVLYPLSEQEQLAAGISNAQYEIIASDEGHDAFLLETTQINKLMSGFMQKHLHDIVPSSSSF